ncbi:MAG: M23 family metallopeptidase [Sulfurimonas sp.]
MIKYLLILSLVITLTFSKEYPAVFSQLGTSLYKSIKHLAKYDDIKELKDKIKAFTQEANATMLNGFEIDKSNNNNARKNYLQKLRKLQKQYDYIIHLMHENIKKSIKNKDYELFIKLTSFELEGLLDNRNIREKSIKFYQTYTGTKISKLLEQKLNKKKILKESEDEFHTEIVQSSYSSNSKNKTHKKRVYLKTKQTGRKIFISIVNNNIYDVTIRIDASYKNILENKNRQKIVVVKAKSTLNYTTLTLGKGKTYYQYQYSWIIGSKYAVHDDSYVYRLPYARGSAHYVSQGFNGGQTHKGRSRYAIDFVMNRGTKVYAARDGLVVKTKSDSSRHGYAEKFAKDGNFVTILHDDGTFATYYHLIKDGVVVKVGDKVYRGEVIAHSGNTGYTSGPHLHFEVYKTVSATAAQSLAIKFLSVRGIVSKPIVGVKYKSK